MTSQPSAEQPDHGFPPMVAKDPRILILGSMPGQQSLQQHQYYGNPNNAFWRIMQDLLEINLDGSYEDRCSELTRKHVAVWDVINKCVRPGSLDSAIRSTSIVANDFAVFLSKHPSIQAIYFNGKKAADEYRRRVLPELETPANTIPCHVLLSTSPANARFRYPEKLDNWRSILSQLG